MAVDPSISSAPSALHGSAAKPYPCSNWPSPPGHGSGFINYGFCRTSLDAGMSREDERCPDTCPHKASVQIAEAFTIHFAKHGAEAAAKFIKEQP